MKRLSYFYHPIHTPGTQFPSLLSVILGLFFIVGSFNAYSQDCTIFAGDDQQLCVNSPLILQGTTTGETDGSGFLWTQTGGPLVTIVSPTSLQTEIEGITGGNVYAFTLSTVCLDVTLVSDVVNVTVLPVTIADAGDDITFCNGGGNLDANTPGVDETGEWSIIGDNFGINISTPSSPTSAVTLSPNNTGTALLRWTINHTNGCSTFDDVMITNAELSEAIISSAPDVCAQNTSTLVAESPLSGTGTWTQESGPNTATIADNQSSTTNISDLITGTYVFKWTISGDPLCDPKSQTAGFDVIDAANAGDDQILCNVTSANLNATPVSVGTGEWIVQSKPLGAPDPTFSPGINSHNATINDLETGEYVLIWKVAAGSCDSSDEVNITVRPSITIEEIAGTTICTGGQVVFTAAAAGGSGSYNYQWQFNNAGIWESVGSNSISFTTPALNEVGNFEYRVIISDQLPADNGGCQTTSSTITIAVVGDPSFTLQPAALTTICAGGNTTLAVTADANTGTPQLLYQWQVSASDSPFDWSDISGANNNSYSTPNLTQTTFYRVVLSASGNGCSTANSSNAKVEINTINAGSIGSDQTICTSTSPAALTSVADATGGGTIEYQWQVSTNGTDYADVPDAEISTYAPGSISADTWFRRVAISTLNGVACNAISNAVKITVTDKPVVDDPGDFVFCNGAATTAIAFTGTPAGLTFNWTNNNTSIGLAASGSGNISSFTATNSTNAPITATITVSPETVDDTSCTGDPINFTITVNPTPSVNSVSNKVFCGGSTTSIIQLTGPVAGSVYSWTNSNPSVGLVASGIGNIPVFDAVNTGTEPITANIGVSPNFTNEGVECIGSTVNFTITVNPIPAITSASSVSICNGNSVGYTIISNVTGTTFSWTAALQSGAASGFSAGSGNTISQVLSNASTSPAVVRYTIVATGPEPSQCAGSPFFLDVTVLPVPVAIATATEALCSGSETDIVLSTSTTGATVTYSWTAALRSGTASGFSNGSGNNISQTLTNTSNEKAVVRYTITPASGTCIGLPIVQDIEVNPSGQVNQPVNQRHCAGASVPQLVFSTSRSDGITTYSWTNSNTAIGLTAAGSGNLPAFTATNSSLGPITATIQVIPVYSNNDSSCEGAPVTFTITINPKGQMNTPADRIVCPGGNVEVAFVSNNSGGTTSFAWSNTNTSIGLAATGNGNISFTSVNSTSGPLTAQISVIPVYINSGVSCPGDPKSFPITVNPVGQVNKPSNVVLCNNSNSAPIVFQTNNTGGTTTYSWVNNTTSIGLPASGAGNISSFVAKNTGTTAVVATITVTPTFTMGTVSCVGSSQQFTITVNPTPSVTSTNELTVCDQTALNYTPESNITGSIFNWTASVIFGSATGVSASGTGSIMDVITNTQGGNSSSEVQYVIIPQSPAGCNGAAFNLNVTVEKCADIAISKTDGSSSFTPGSTVQYTVVVNNNGPSDAFGLILTDVAPTGTSITSWSAVFAGGATGNANGSGNLSEAINVPDDATATYAIQVYVPSTFTGNLSNTATVSVPSGLKDNNLTNNTATDTSTQNSLADLRLSMMGSPETVVAGENITYTLTLTNLGPSVAQTVQVQDVLPTSLAFVSATPSKGTWTTPNWIVGSLAVNETVTMILVARVKSNVVSNVTNSATATSSTTDPVPGNNSASATTAIVTRADLSITISDSPDPVVAGETLTYSIVVRNNGPSDALNVKVSDAMPAGVSFVNAIPSMGTWSSSTWTIASLASESQATLTLVTRVNSNLTTEIVNTVTVSSNTTDPVSANNSDTESTNISTLANLSVTKIADSNQVTAGENVKYTIRVNNNGPSNALNVRVQDILPSQLQFVSASPETGSWAAPLWNVGTLIPGQEVSMELVATVKSGATGIIVNTATVTSNTTDPTPANNTADHELSVNATASLTIDKTGPVEIIAGSKINYSLLIGNQGPSDALNVKVTDVLPAGLSGAEYSIDGGNNWISWTGTYTRPTLSAGSDFEVQLRANTLGSLPNGQVITNDAKVSSPTATSEVGDDAVTTVKTSADLVMLKTRAAGVVLAGQNIQYTLTVTNLGPSNAQNVVVTDILPANLTFVSALPGSGIWLSPNWTIDVLNAGATANMQLIARVNAGVANGTIILNEASVTSNTSDPIASNNADDVSVSVNTETDLSIANAVDEDTPDVGSEVVFTIRVTNQGPSNATAVAVNDLLSTGFTYVSHSGGTYDSANDVWTVGNMSIGNTAQLTLTARVNPSGNYTTTSVVGGNENDPELTNNVVSVSVVPRPIANLALVKTVNVPNQSVGQDVVFSIAVTNNGPSNATNVRVNYNPPTGFSYQSHSTVAGSYNSGTGIWSVGNLNSGSTVTLQITAEVKATGPYVGSAVASANEFDPVTSNNSAVAGISVIQAVDDNFNANPINGFIGGTAGNVLLNDRLQGLEVDDDKITISLIDNGGLSGLTINANGNLVIPSGSIAGIYIASYRICEIELPQNCDIAEVLFTVNPPVILAMNDNFSSTPINGMSGGIAGNVLTNDRLNNAVINPNQVSLLITQNGGLTGVSLNQTGQITIPAKTRAGVYVITYQLCEKLNSANCDDAQVTVLVTAAPILAVDDDFTGNPISGIGGGIAGNIISNDRLNGLAININDINFSLVNNGGITNLAINQQGQAVIPPGTSAGQYTFTYRICEVLNPDNCDEAQAVVLVSSASIIAGNDTFGPINGYTGSASAGNILLNDQLNGEVVNTNTIAISTVSIDEGLQLNTTTGVVSVLSATPQGVYELVYRICEILNPTNCDDALVSVNVVAASIIANNDSFGPVNGFTGAPNMGNILTNDMLNGAPVLVDEITITTLSLDDPLTLNVETGFMGVLAGTASGTYSAEYQICEKLNPGNCNNAQVSVVVGSATIIANDDVYGPVNGYTGNSNLGNILNNDILNGVSVVPNLVDISIVSSDSELIILDTETGMIGLKPGISAGIYEMEYRICEIINPENCNTGLVTIVVVAPQISAINDVFGPVSGIDGMENAGNILSNDLISGQEFDASDVLISILSTNLPDEIALDTNTGLISVAPLTPGGTYTMSYRICDILNPTNCDQANVSVTVEPFADLSIEKTANTPNPGIDKQLTFTLTVTNNGPNNASGVIAIDELNTGFTYVSDNSGGSWVPETGIWTVGDLENGASVSIDIVVKVNAEGSYINTASVSGAQPDPVATNNVSEINLSPGKTADLSIMKTLDNLVVDVNSNVVFTLIAANQGPADATNVVVTDLLPSGLTYNTHSGAGSYTPENGIWDIGSIQNGQEVQLFITALVNPSGEYTNKAVISGSEPDSDLTNNSDEATVTAIPVADLNIIKTVDQQRSPEGSQVVFTLTVTNLGPSEAMDVEADDLLPSGLTYISDDSGGSYNPNTGKWEIGAMTAEAEVSLQITALVNPDGDYENIASVISTTKDPDENNNSSSVTIITSNEADLGIVKTADRERASVGTEILFYITITNNGPDIAKDVILIDLLPDGFDYVSHKGPGDYNPFTGEWIIGELANQLTVNLEISTRIRANGDYTNIAEVTSGEYDPIPANNVDSQTIVVDRELVIPEGFSPGDDGFNDLFVIYGLEQYPNNHLSIVNRWGSKVYEASPYKNDWDGSNIFGVSLGGRDLPEGTYFYILDLREEGMEPIKGFIYLKR
jgi:large repetitive protein